MIVCAFAFCALMSLGLPGQGLSKAVEGEGVKTKVQEVVGDLKAGVWTRQGEIVSLGSSAIPALAPYVSNGQQEIRRFAIDCIGRIASRDGRSQISEHDGVDLLSQALTDPDGLVVKQAATHLKYLDPRMVNDELLNRLFVATKEKRVYQAALRLGEFGTSATAEKLLALGGSSDSVGVAVRMALARLGNHEITRDIVGELASVDKQRRDDAIKKLAYVRDRSTVSSVAAFLYFNEPGPTPGSDYYPLLTVQVAAEALGEMVANPPMKKRAQEIHAVDIEEWRAWWKANKSKYP